MAEICKKQIVTVRDVCAGERTNPSSGYDLMDAPEISVGSLASIAKPEYLSGLELARKKVDLAILEVESDFITLLKTNGLAANILSRPISTGGFKNTSQNAVAPMERGITIYKNPRQSALKKLKISQVSIYPVSYSGVANLMFYDDGYVSSIPVELVGGQINTFDVEYVVQGSFVRILLDNTSIATYTSALTCLLGCNGSEPNECGYVKGYNGMAEVQKEGFGINAVFSCECDFSELLCMFSKNYIGKVVWLKTRALLMEERLETPRLNAWVIFGREEAANKRIELENAYREAWNMFVSSLPELLKYTKSDCLTCNGIQIVTNV